MSAIILTGSITPSGGAGSATGSDPVAAPAGVYGTMSVYFDDTQPANAVVECYLVPFKSGHDSGFGADEEVKVATFTKTESDGTDETVTNRLELPAVTAAGAAGGAGQFFWGSGNMTVKVASADPTGAIQYKIEGVPAGG